MTNINIPESVTKIGEHAFYNCNNLTDISLPDSITSIGEFAFCGCENLTSISLPKYITKIPRSSFVECKKLSDTSIPDSVTIIKERAFYDCINLLNITIPESVTMIENNAFNSLNTITILNPECKFEKIAFYTSDIDKVIIYGYENSTAQLYAEKYNGSYTFISLGPAPTYSQTPGDCNNDNNLNISDLLLLKKWITHYTPENFNIKNADLNNNGVVNIFDLCILKRKLLS